MAKKDTRIDDYIAKAQPFAQPILQHLRDLIHKAVPDVQENIKWGMPSFEYKGQFCHFAAFKQHAVLGLWKTALLDDPDGYLQERASQGGDAMGNLGRITCLADLPPDDIILQFFLKAKKLNDEGVKIVKPKKERVELDIPQYFSVALKGNQAAQTTFDQFSPSNKKEYLDWVTGAKTERTRLERLATAIEWMSEGKVRMWKYAKK